MTTVNEIYLHEINSFYRFITTATIFAFSSFFLIRHFARGSNRKSRENGSITKISLN